MKRKILIIFCLLVVSAAGFFIILEKGSFSIVNKTTNYFLGDKEILKTFGHLPETPSVQNSLAPDFSILWASDFQSNRILGLSPDGKILWEQNMDASPIPLSGLAVHTEYVTLAPNGNLIVSDGDAMFVQEIDRNTHQLLWQYGVRSKQLVAGGLHQPDKAYKFNDHEVVINDGNNRRVIIVDQNTNKVVWQYGHDLEMGSSPGYLRGNTSVRPINSGQQFIITDTLENKIMIIDRATKQIVWQFQKPAAKWLEHVFPTAEDTFILEDRQKNEVFEINRAGQILWTLNKLADGSTLKYPTDTIKLPNGHILIAEAGNERIIEVVPATSEIVRQWGGKNSGVSLGYITTIAVDYQPPPAGNQVEAGKNYVFVGPRGNLPKDAPSDYGLWSLAISVPGVLSRSGQPLLSGFQWLKANGWKSVVDLRVDGERGEVGDDTKIEGFNALGFNYLALPIADGSPPTDKQAEEFLTFVTNSANQPVHVHCRGGIGRTSVMVALYRYSVQGWPLQKAIDESRPFEGGMSDSQQKWLENWQQNHLPGSDNK